jgi:hypothetical protein
MAPAPNYIPTAEIIYASNSSGLAGAFFGGIMSAVACAAAVMFATGPGRAHFMRLAAAAGVSGGAGAGSGGSAVAGASGDSDRASLIASSAGGQKRGGGLASQGRGGYGSTSVTASGAKTTDL